MKVLFRSYRIEQYSDPEGFKVNTGLVLEQYPIDTIKFVTDPRTGIQRRCNWPPTIKEVVDACEQHMHDKAKAERYRNWGKKDTLTLKLQGPKEPKPTREEMIARYGENWGLSPNGFGSSKGFDWDAAGKRLMEKYPDAK